MANSYDRDYPYQGGAGGHHDRPYDNQPYGGSSPRGGGRDFGAARGGAGVAGERRGRGGAYGGGRGGRGSYDGGASSYEYQDRELYYGDDGGGGYPYEREPMRWDGHDNRGRRNDWDGRRGDGERDFKMARYDSYEHGNGPAGGGYCDVPPPRRDEYSAPYPQQPPGPRQDPSYDPYVGGAPPYGHAPPGGGGRDEYWDDEYTQSSARGDYPPASSGSRRGADSRPADDHRPRPAPVKPEPPSASVVLLGLPPTVDDAALRAFLEDMGASIDSTTVIMERSTGISKRYGFAKFGSVEHARAFVEPNFPSVPWKERGKGGTGKDDGMRIKINYSQKTGGWREDQGAGIRLNDDQRKQVDGGKGHQSFYVNDGMRDVGSAPTQILLLRGLDPLTVEDEIVAAIGAMPGRAGMEVREGQGVKKVFITRDRGSRQSWGYAFVQFSDVRLATEVLGTAFNSKLYPTGFRIRSSVVAFSFCHENSFVPIYARSEWSFLGEGGQQLAYWDDKAFVAPWTPPKKVVAAAGSSPALAAAAAPVPVTAAESDVDAFFASMEAEVPSIAESLAAAAPPSVTVVVESSPAVPATPQRSALPPKSLPVAPGSGISISLKPNAGAFEAEDKVKAAIKARKGKEVALDVASSPAFDKKDKKGGDLIVSRKAAKDISKWNVKQQELRPEPLPTSAPSAPSVPSAPKAKAAESATASTSAARPAGNTSVPVTEAPTPVAAAAPTFEYGDLVTMICLLCQRQFKSVDDLAKHNRLSALHKTNLANPSTVTDALKRKATADAKAASAAAATSAPAVVDAAPKYVDRAAARREAYNQPDHPMPDSKKRKFEPAPLPPPPAPLEQPNRNGIEESNVGSKLLAKMGWSKGEGLGSSGDGRVAPVQAAQFQQGAGLGSTKGVVVGDQFVTPSTYKEALREKARQRLAE